MACAGTKFVFECSDVAKEVLLREGLDARYGARHLKRSVERLLVSPLSNLVASGQVGTDDLILVDLDRETESLSFSKRPGSASLCEMADLVEPEIETLPYSGIGLALPQLQVASIFS